jgi:macrodomain Ter protein organizer (MatP/YcbG family)
MVRLNDDVYFSLKARAVREGKTLSGTVYALMHTADDYASAEKRLASIELKIDALTQLLSEEQLPLRL